MKHVTWTLMYALTLSSTPLLAEAQKFKVELIGQGDTNAVSLNDLGEVTGYRILPGSHRRPTAFLYRNGRFHNVLGNAIGFDINNRSEIVGSHSPGPDPGRYGFLYSDGHIKNITTALDSRDVTPRAINDLGHAVGFAEGRPFYFDGNTSRYLDLGDFSSAYAFDINDHDAIVGTIDDISSAYVYQEGQLTLLPSLSSYGTAAYAINNAGQIVGASREPHNAEFRPVLFQDGTITDLGALLGDVGGRAYDINEKGWIAGVSADATDITGFLYRNGTMHNLNDLLWGDSADKVKVLSATHINEAGQLLAIGRRLDGTFATQPLLLTPVPEAGTLVFMGLGLGVIGMMVRRRKET